MNTMYGWKGSMLRVDLTSGGVHRVPSDDLAQRFVGGRGFISKIYWDEVDPAIDAFNPDNPLMLMTGPRAPHPAGPRKIVSACDAAELEIMERLDAIIPGGSGPKSHSSPKASFGVAATATARQLHDPIHGDLAAPATDDDVAGDEIPSPAQQAEKQDLHHVVPFDRAKRSRKGKRGRGAKAGSAAPPPPAADAVPLPVGGEHSSEIPCDGAKDERSAPAAWSAQHGTPADLPEREPLTSGAFVMNSPTPTAITT